MYMISLINLRFKILSYTLIRKVGWDLWISSFFPSFSLVLSLCLEITLFIYSANNYWPTIKCQVLCFQWWIRNSPWPGRLAIWDLLYFHWVLSHSDENVTCTLCFSPHNYLVRIGHYFSNVSTIWMAENSELLADGREVKIWGG